jgi:hypothetical protein
MFMTLVPGLRRRNLLRQRDFSFIERSRLRERWFKGTILAATCLVIAILLGAWSRGRYVVSTLAIEARHAARRAIGAPRPRSEIDESWKLYREHGIAESHQALIRDYNGTSPAMQRLMRYAGLDPAHGLLRWGNYNYTLLLPSTIFEADESGRSYRLRPNTRSIWLREVALKSNITTFFLVPDRPELAEAIQGTTAIPVWTSRQTTNSWGLRGPEPDPAAPRRGIVLGDSYMQGLFIGDDDTPPERLRRYLEAQLETRVSLLNTGVLGYSPEQYYHALVAFADRFRPQFVVVSVFTNDFGDLYDVPAKGRGDWEEGKYWLDKITQYCLAREWVHLIVPAPFEPHMLGQRRSGYYPGTVSNILQVNSLMFLDPTDDLINAHLQLVIQGEREGHRPRGCPLFNVRIGDGHFSPPGSEAWAASVGRRLVLLLQMDDAVRQRQRNQDRGDQPPRTTGRPEAVNPGATGS